MLYPRLKVLRVFNLEQELDGDKKYRELVVMTGWTEVIIYDF